MSKTREERETIIRFDETDAPAYLSTFSAIQARRWQRVGIVLEQRGGELIGRVDKRRIRLGKLRTLVNLQGRRDQLRANLARARATRPMPENPGISR